MARKHGVYLDIEIKYTINIIIILYNTKEAELPCLACIASLCGDYMHHTGRVFSLLSLELISEADASILWCTSTYQPQAE